MIMIKKNENRESCFEIIVISALILFLLLSCSTGNHGRLTHSREVAHAFETYHVYPNHRYYYLNLEKNPWAVIALREPYTVSKRQWTEFDPNSNKFEKLVNLVKDFPFEYSNTYGSIIQDPQGNQVGYWYSSLWMRSITINEESKLVSIYTDNPSLRDDDYGYRPGVGVGVGSGGGGIGIRFGF